MSTFIGSSATEEDIQRFLNSMQEDMEEDELYFPQEHDECGDIRYYDGEYWKWKTFEDELKDWTIDVKEPEKICSTEY